MIRMIVFLGAALSLAACDEMPAFLQPAAAPAPAEAPAEAAPPPPPDEIAEVVSAPPPPPAANTVAALDTTTEAQKEAAREAAEASDGALLGTTIAALGDPTEPGLWLRTPLVTEAQAGKIETAAGVSALVQLVPLDAPVGAGSQMSIGAFQALGLTLTDLPTLSVYGA